MAVAVVQVQRGNFGARGVHDRGIAFASREHSEGCVSIFLISEELMVEVRVKTRLEDGRSVKYGWSVYWSRLPRYV